MDIEPNVLACTLTQIGDHMETAIDVRSSTEVLWEGPREIMKRLIEWPLGFVVLYLVKKMGYTAKHAEAMRLEYLKYQALVIAHRGVPIPIARGVDEFWHVHILHTADYIAFGKKFAGSYLHHRPELDASALSNAYAENTIPLYEAAFGKLEKVWEPNVQVCLGPSCDPVCTSDN